MPGNKSLLDAAKADMKASHAILSLYDDDLSINLAAYHIQQAVEKSLKFRINMLGESFPQTHNIGHLIDVLEKLNETLPDWLLFEARRLTEFEAQSRYILDFLASKKEVLGLLTATEGLIASFEPKSVSPERVTCNNYVNNIKPI